MRYYWQLQHTRIKRWLIYFGINPKAAYVVTPVLLYALVKLLFVKTIYAGYLVGWIYLMVITPLSEFKRNIFLKYTYKKSNHLKIRFIENISLAALFSLSMFIAGYGIVSSFPLLLGLLASYYNRVGKINFKIPTLFSKHPYEFTVGFREYLLVFLIQIILVGIGIAVDNYNLAVVVYGSLFLLLCSFYSKMESYFFVWVHTDTPKTFIHKKIKIALRYGLYSALLPLLILIILFPDYYWISLLVTVVGLLYIVYMTVLKYAQYPLAFNIINTLITFISIGFPFFMLITIPYYYKKARQNLKLELL